MNFDFKICPQNIILDWGAFEDWENGASLAPTEYTLAGTGAAISQESTTKKFGNYSAKITSGSGEATLYRDVEDLLDIYAGRKYTFGVWVYCSTASKARISIYDGVGITYSSYHTGGGDWEFLEVTRDLDDSATGLRITIHVEATSVIAYCDGCVLVEGDTLFTDLDDGNVAIDKARPEMDFSFSDAEVPRRPGTKIITQKMTGLVYNFSGSIIGSSLTNTRSNFDTLKKALFSGMKDLYVYDDRVLRGYLSGFKPVPHEKAIRLVTFSFDFQVDDIPTSMYFNKKRVTQAVSSSPTSFTVTNNGTAETWPQILFVAGGTDITSLSLENLTTGEVFGFTDTVSAGDTLIMDADEMTLENDGADAIAYFSNGDFLKLVPGDNILKFTGSNCTIKVDFFERFL